MPDIDPEELKVFLQEVDEQLQLLDEDIIRLEKEPDDADLIQEIFRAAHTLKGSSGMLGYKKMAGLTHVMEDTLDRVRAGKLGVTAELIDSLRKYDKKTFYAVNKIDGPKKEKAIYDFYSLGVDLYPLSALNGYGYEDLMEKMISILPESEEEESEYPKIAIVGRPNVGKSTLVNSLLSKDRMSVSPVAGTTRDAVDSLCTYYKKKYTLVDTAGSPDSANSFR